jgi:hypothetical protein
MSEKLNSMFEANEAQEVPTGARSLAGTAQLTTLANTVANEVIKKIDTDLENYREKFDASKSDHNAMDALITELYDLTTVDVQFIKELDDDTVESMLKSQQSKRSRSKSKVMTLDNYKSMMTGAAAELLIRQATGKAKSATSVRRLSGSIEFTAEELEKLKDDQDAVKRELRNVQSKKSIMKTKADFSEESERWQQLLVAEEQLKSIRTSSSTVKTIRVDETKDALLAEIGDTALEDLKPAEAKKLLQKVLAAVAVKPE